MTRVTFFLFLILQISKAEAQNNDDLSIYVYANALVEPGQSLTIRSNDESDQQGLQFFKKLNINSNLTLSKTSSFGGVQNILLRGANSDQVQVTLDGAVMNDPGSTGRGVNLADFNYLNLSEVDIYYGPHASALGNHANSGALNFKSKEVTRPTLMLRGGSYETKGASFIIPIEKLHQQWEWSGFDTRGMSSFNQGEEHDGLKEQHFKIKGNNKIATSVELNYFLLTQWKSEDLDFGGGTSADDADYKSNDKLVLPFIELKFMNKSCYTNKLSIQRSLREKTTKNEVDPVNSNRTFDVIHSTNDIYKLQSDFFCSLDNTTSIVTQYEHEQMSSLTKGDTNNERPLIGQKYFSLSLLQEHKISKQQKLNGNIKVDRWNQQSNLSSYQLAYLYQWDVFQLSPSFAFARKIPSLYQRFSSYGRADLEREKNWQTELSIKMKKENYQLELAPFYSTYQQMVDFDSATNKYFNIGKTNIYGAETRNTFNIVSAISTKFNLTYLKAYNATNGSNLILRPHWQMSNIWLYTKDRYDIEWQAQYVGRRSAYDAITSDRITTHSFLVFNLLNRWKINSQISLNTSVINILNKQYVETPGYSTLGLSLFSEISYVF